MLFRRQTMPAPKALKGADRQLGPISRGGASVETAGPKQSAQIKSGAAGGARRRLGGMVGIFLGEKMRRM